MRENPSDRAVISQSNREVENLQEGMLYEEARELLIQQGWQPNLQGEPPNLTDVSVGNLFGLGYEEIKDCSGTGEAPCRFEFINERGELLVVVAIPQRSPNWFVRNWWIEQWQGPVLPFIGTRAFNFLGGTGTGHTITIAEDGRTTIEIHGTAGSTVIYQGAFSNPLSVESGLGLLLKDDKIYQLSPDGEIATDCKGEGTICEAELYELEFRP
ncbi:MAG TPA: hypothetical protein IGS17_17030 [Oscillatoriales cyanobacterium M59_W2019_021]|nr:hypothetical protein [Oscillatoriales cyanobacterium M4454_W2019_049]HIK52610.1 hypothetical protein [Oscillatoriales cyanobacterium M59_W2019_021]